MIPDYIIWQNFAATQQMVIFVQALYRAQDFGPDPRHGKWKHLCEQMTIGATRRTGQNTSRIVEFILSDDLNKLWGKES